LGEVACGKRWMCRTQRGGRRKRKEGGGRFKGPLSGGVVLERGGVKRVPQKAFRL